MIRSMTNGRVPGHLRLAATAAAVCAVYAACTACAGETTNATPATSTTPPSSAPAESSPPSPPPAETREITLEVNGKGKIVQPIVYVADTLGSESDVTLPWKKTVTLTLTAAERKVGRLVSITPGAIRAADGTYKPAECRILVQGKVVATNEENETMCEYTVK